MAQPSGAKFPLLAPALIFGLALVWGANWPIMKIALVEIPVWTFRAWSSLAAGLSMLALARLSGHRLAPQPEDWRGLVLGATFNCFGWQILIAFGLQRVGSGHAAVLGFTMPLWAVLLGWLFLGEKINLRSLAALLLGLAGIAVLLSPDFASLGRAPLGALITMGGAFSWAIGTVMHKGHRSTLSTLAMTGWQVTLSALPMLAMLPLVGEIAWPHASGAAWAATFYTTFVALVFGYFAWFKIVGLLPVHVASISTLLVPGIGVVSGALMLGEPVGLPELLAFLLIGSALGLVLFAPKPRAAVEQAT